MGQMVHLHVHTEQGGFDGFGAVDDFVKTVAERGNPAMACSEHGTVRGVHELASACKDHGIKPIYGCELYLADDMRKKGLPQIDIDAIKSEVAARDGGGTAADKRDAIYQAEATLGLRDRNHITVFAMDNEGLHNLFRLTTAGWLEGFYHRPRVDLSALEEYGDGLIVLSGCLNGLISSAILKGGFERAIEITERLRTRFGDRFYIEIMPHSMADQATANLGLVEIARAMDIPVVATQDAHYIGRTDWRFQEAMLCSHTHSVMLSPKRFRFETREFWLRSRPEMEEAFARFHPGIPKAVYETALDNTLVVAERCNVELKSRRSFVPEPLIPAPFTDGEMYFQSLCDEGWKRLQIYRKCKDEAQLQVYRQRLAHELRVIRERGVTDYFLAIYEMYERAKSKGIFMGPGRGSAAGCLVSWLIGITQVDPIEHGLLFERFLAPGRMDLPDIDCDVERDRRDEVIAGLEARYGSDRFARISTILALRGRAAVREVGRIYQIPLSEIEPVCSMIPETYTTEEEKDEGVLGKIFESDDTCYAFARRYPPVAECAVRIEGGVKGLGVHPAGVVITPMPLVEACPLEARTSKGQQTVVTAVDMHGAETLGLVKIDVLGLRNLTVIRHALEAVEQMTGKKLDLTKVPLTDKKVFAGLSKRHLVGIFQMDTALGYELCKQIKFTQFSDIAAFGAISRPGVSHSGLAEEYLAKKARGAANRKVSNLPAVDVICSDSCGVTIFQEHVMLIAQTLGGYTPQEANDLRKLIGKKAGKHAVRAEMERFIRQAVERGHPEDDIRKLAQQIEHAGAYMFNKSHAVSYGLISYWEMWLKIHYPLEFVWALLCCAQDDDEQVRYADEAKRLEVPILPPDVNLAGAKWRLERSGLVMSLLGLKGIGPAAVAAVEDARPFSDFVDFMDRVDKRRCNRRIVSILLQTGAMNGIVPNPAWLNENLESVWKLAGRKGWKDEVAGLLIDSVNAPTWTVEETNRLVRQYCPITFTG
jgi:DNA polymerase III subunit alpha